ncbi:MAG TPA: hypothetical protein VH575_36460 [Gemmataceae bacterium]|jgi:hypothetical protein
MKCVSIHQPWAAAIFAGLVDTEYRCYPTDYRGDLLVHASQDVSDWDRRQLVFFGKRAPCWERLLFGRVIGVVELWSCDVGSNGEWVWRLRNPRLVKPFPINPGRRLFEVEDQRIKVLASHGSATGNSQENIEQTGEAMRALSVLKARDPERRRKVAEARRGKP